MLFMIFMSNIILISQFSLCPSLPLSLPSSLWFYFFSVFSWHSVFHVVQQRSPRVKSTTWDMMTSFVRIVSFKTYVISVTFLHKYQHQFFLCGVHFLWFTYSYILELSVFLGISVVSFLLCFWNGTEWYCLGCIVKY